MLNEKRWNNLINHLTGNPPPSDSFRQLVEAYSEPHRCYHNITHIEHCLEEFDAVMSLCKLPDEVEFAIWLHDVVYDPHASDNEEMSALSAREILSESSCPETKTDNIRELILATRHIHPPATMDAQLIVDIDLSILGQIPIIFNKYEENIRAEYSWVSEEAYRFGRSRILRGFLDKPSIYSTDRFEKMFGNQARENITRVLTALALSPEGAS
jgi:predicted metal-dependent HD superfamily phosphohydrolase